MEKKNYMAKEIGGFSNLLTYEFQGNKGKYFFGRELGLTGCEGSLAYLPAGAEIPFLHAHNQNEELYVVISGNGQFAVDGETFPVQEGSLIRVSPDGERGLKAGSKDLCYLCLQMKAGSLSQATLDDAKIIEKPLPWAK